MRCGILIAVLITSPMGWTAAAAGEPPPMSNPADSEEFTPQQLEFFEQRIRPLLAEHCWKCHGAQKQKAGLRLDARARILQGGETGPALIPGHVDDSELIRAVRYDPDGYQMPPDGKLPAEQIALLERWVAEGAAWPADTARQTEANSAPDDFASRARHWAFQPLHKPQSPEVQDSSWARTPIDRFILSELARRGLRPAPPAERSVLLRRASVDIVGLPPTLQEQVRVRDEQSLSRQIDAWLASPHFGERWGRHWLDLVRYAESRGHEFDYDVPNAWQYRDYVIRAMNADVPYDQLVTEHVAGDLLESGTGTPFCRRVNPASGVDESVLGTGFWYFGEWVHSPVDLEQDEADRVQNMVDVFSKAFLGLTVSCARCHDHKFDPITQQDYYALAGYVASGIYAQVPFETRAHNGELADELCQIDDDAAECVRQWIAPQGHGAAPLTESPGDPPAVAGIRADDVIIDYRQPDARVISDAFAFGARPRRAGDVVWGSSADRPVISIVTEPAVMRDPVWRDCRAAAHVMEDTGVETWHRAGRTLATPSFVVGPGNVYAWVRGGCRTYAAVNSHLTIKGPLHGGLLKDHPAAPEWRWIEHDLGRYRGHRAHLEFVLREDDDFAVAVVVQGETPPAPLPPSAPAEVRELAARIDGGAIDPEIALLQDRLRPLYEGHAVLCPKISTTSAVAPAMLEGSGVDLPLFIRGNPHKTGDLVPRRFLEIFLNDASRAAAPGTEAACGPLPAQHGAPRLELARRMVDPARTPLTARVIVNRVWQHYFGAGLVTSSDDFGRMGQPPSHPELLDWLACDFVEHAWSLKRLHRLILDSAVYRQASYLPLDSDQATGERWVSADRTDPANIWLHRMSIKRMEGEALRDAILRTSGRLDERMYDPSVPVHLTEHHEGRGRPAVSGPVDGDGRRSLYIAVRRNFPEPLLQAFDFPIPSTTRGRRSVSNVPAQALALLNNPFVISEAQLFARNLVEEERDGDDATGRRIRLAFRRAFSREPSPEELRESQEFLATDAADRQAVPSVEVWSDFCHALLNAKEFQFVP